jgi:hypothetical protein
MISTAGRDGSIRGRVDGQLAFRISVRDRVAYVHAVYKTRGMDGKETMAAIERYCKTRGDVESVRLQDASKVHCSDKRISYSLSFRSRLKHRRTWYELLGYKGYKYNAIHEEEHVSNPNPEESRRAFLADKEAADKALTLFSRAKAHTMLTAIGRVPSVEVPPPLSKLESWKTYLLRLECHVYARLISHVYGFAPYAVPSEAIAHNAGMRDHLDLFNRANVFAIHPNMYVWEKKL